MRSAAKAHADRGDSARAGGLMSQALEVSTKCCGREYAQVVLTIRSMEHASNLGAPAKQRDLLEQAMLVLWRSAMGNRPEVERTARMLREAQQAHGDVARSRELLDRAEAALLRRAEKEDREFAGVLGGLARAYTDLGWARSRSSEQALCSKGSGAAEEALRAVVRHSRSEWREAVAPLSSLVRACADVEDPAEARGLLRRALDILQRHLGDEHPEVVGHLQGLAFVGVDLSEASTARERVLQAMSAVGVSPRSVLL